jgi:NAD(P)-dependent dehydrogenase (short-subunit alcohol dehydrogenase family)
MGPGVGDRSSQVGPFVDRVVAVTGSSGQIGRACVDAFVAAGARVAGIDRDAPDLGDGVLAVAADLADPAQIDAAFAEVERELGPAAVLVQSAAVHARVPFLEISAENIDHVLGINVRAVLLAGRRAAAAMVDAGVADGAIVNLTSVSGVVSDAESIAYEASKGAVTMATRGMAVALAPHGIRVNAVGPGSMAKFQELPARDPHDVDDYERRRIPLGRLGVGSEIADAVLFLASPASAYVTGTTLYVDGGSLAAW